MAEVPAETVLTLRLLTAVSTYRSKPGDKVEALVMPSVNPRHPSALPEGAMVYGSVKGIRKVGLGLVHEKAELQLEFSELALPDGGRYALKSRVISVENARENVDRNGKIHGIRATYSLSNRMGSRLAFAAWADPDLWIPIFAAETLLFDFPDPEINFATGTELGIKLEQPIPWSAPAEVQTVNATPESDQEPGLRALVGEMPEWSYSVRERKPMDPITLAFVGTGEEIQRTFAAAGWTGAKALSWVTGLGAARAIAASQAFANAPMRILLVDNAEPDFSFQKTLDTFQKRDHLRLWKSPETWQGQTVWVSAATRDVSTSFSVQPFGFTHRIEKDVDLERDSVVDDLFFSGCVDSVTYLPRPPTATSDRPGTRKGMTSDGEVAVISLNSCATPRHDFSALDNQVGPGVAVRALRRVILTARNHVLRDNLIWRTGEVVRLASHPVYTWVKGKRSDDQQQPIAQTQAGPRAAAGSGQADSSVGECGSGERRTLRCGFPLSMLSDLR